MNLENSKLINIYGGGWTAAYLNAAARAANTILDLGRTVGTSIRRFFSKKYC